MEPIFWRMDEAREASGVSPGDPLPEEIVLARAVIDTPAYSGGVEVSIDEEWDGLLDLKVFHDEDPDFDGLYHLLAHDTEFQAAVIRLLQDRGRLPSGDGFELEPAESGMQDEDLAVFERLLRHGEDVGKAVAALWGAADGELAGSLRNLLGLSGE